MNETASNKSVLPLAWLAGAGMAASQILLQSGCSVPNSGRCNVCGGCMVALAGLSGWALMRSKNTSETTAE